MFYAVGLLFFLYGCLALVAAIAVIAVIVSFIGKKETRDRRFKTAFWVPLVFVMTIALSCLLFSLATFTDPLPTVGKAQRIVFWISTLSLAALLAAVTAKRIK
ncbi:MAG: hypothetical protein J5808_07845 [Paludibacteraceae bacterium]|nr:hypothetical protein [Paludibacteraceae bacterium]